MASHYYGTDHRTEPYGYHYGPQEPTSTRTRPSRPTRASSSQARQLAQIELDNVERLITFGDISTAFSAIDSLLIQHDPPIDVTPLLVPACAAARTDVVAHLIARGANRGPRFKVSPLNTSSVLADAGLVSELIAAGINPSSHDSNGTSALHVAAEHGYTETVRALIGAGAEFGALDSGSRTALHVAALHGHAEICRTLLDAGLQIDRGDLSGLTPLRLAAGAGHGNVCCLLVSRGADPNRRAKDRQTPLQIASPEIHEILLMANQTDGPKYVAYPAGVIRIR